MLNEPPPLPTSPPPDCIPNGGKPKIFFQCLTTFDGTLTGGDQGFSECNNNNVVVHDKNKNNKNNACGDSAFGSQTSIDHSNSSSNGSQERTKGECYVLQEEVQQTAAEEDIFEPRPVAELKVTSPSITTLKPRLQHRPSVKFKSFNEQEKNSWLNASCQNGFIRLFDPTSNFSCSLVIPCTMDTSSHEIASRLGLKTDAIHVQYGGDLVRRMAPADCPVKIQNAYLEAIGIDEDHRRREMGDYLSLGYLIRFFAGKRLI